MAPDPAKPGLPPERVFPPMSHSARLEVTRALIGLASGRPELARRLSPEAWSATAWLAEAHGLAAAAPGARAAGAPPGVAAALDELASRTRARYERLQSDLGAVRAEFLRVGVPHLPLKAAWLWEKGLADPDRPAADLDFYVPAPEMARAESALVALGYRRLLVTRRHSVFVRVGNEQVVDARGEHPDNPRPVEIHSRLAEAHRGIELDLTSEIHRGPSVASLGPGRDRVAEVDVTSLQVSAPASFEMSITLAVALVHMASHSSVDLLNGKLRAVALLDLARVARWLSDGDWEAVIHIAANRHAARFVWPALRLAIDETQAPVPEKVVAMLAGEVRRPLVSLMRELNVDLVSRLGAADRRRTLTETLRIWPTTPAEHLTVWKHIVLPGADVLAERWTDAGEMSQAALFTRHMSYSWSVMRRRWGQRAAR